MIEVNLSKRYGDKLSVDRLSFRVEPGRVAGFFGRDGAGKSTAMRLVRGLDHAGTGMATIGGRRYAYLSQPLRTAGALLDAEVRSPDAARLAGLVTAEGGTVAAAADGGQLGALSVTPWQGLAVFCAWTAVLLATASYLFRRRAA